MVSETGVVDLACTVPKDTIDEDSSIAIDDVIDSISNDVVVGLDRMVLEEFSIKN